MKNEKTRINGDIEAEIVLVIDSDGEQLGEMALSKALDIASSKSLDLVEVAPMAQPPVCKILDWGREKFQKQKVKKAAKVKQHTIQLKEIQLRPVTDPHDIDIKMSKATKFLGKGNKVKFVMRFRGRERQHSDNGMIIMRAIIERLGEDINVETQPKMNGNSIQMIVGPKS